MIGLQVHHVNAAGALMGFCPRLHATLGHVVLHVPVGQEMDAEQIADYAPCSRVGLLGTHQDVYKRQHMNFGLAAQSWHDNLPTHSVTVVLLSPLGFPIQVSR